MHLYEVGALVSPYGKCTAEIMPIFQTSYENQIGHTCVGRDWRHESRADCIPSSACSTQAGGGTHSIWGLQGHKRTICRAARYTKNSQNSFCEGASSKRPLSRAIRGRSFGVFPCFKLIVFCSSCEDQIAQLGTSRVFYKDCGIKIQIKQWFGWMFGASVS